MERCQNEIQSINFFLVTWEALSMLHVPYGVPMTPSDHHIHMVLPCQTSFGSSTLIYNFFASFYILYIYHNEIISIVCIEMFEIKLGNSYLHFEIVEYIFEC